MVVVGPAAAPAAERPEQAPLGLFLLPDEAGAWRGVEWSGVEKVVVVRSVSRGLRLATAVPPWSRHTHTYGGPKKRTARAGGQRCPPPPPQAPAARGRPPPGRRAAF